MRTERKKLERKQHDKKLAEEYTTFHAKNLDKLETCKRCNRTDYLKNFVANFWFRDTCKLCHAGRMKRWRKANPDMAETLRVRSYVKSADYIESHKIGSPCADCGLIYPPCAMDFNHLDMSKKSDTISGLYGKSKERIEKEINKCELICANCHREKTQQNMILVPTCKNRRLRPEIIDAEIKLGDPTKKCAKCDRKKHIDDFSLLQTGQRHSYCRKCLREYNNSAKRENYTPSAKLIKALKDNEPCSDCGRRFRYWVMDFDHVAGDKVKNVNQLRRRNVGSVRDEIEKCELVCAACHRMRTHRRKLNEKKSSQCGCQDFNFRQAELNLFMEKLGVCPLTKFAIIDINKSHESVPNCRSIFSDEWINRRALIETIIKNALGVTRVKMTLRPTACVIQLITTSIADSFYDRFHYIGKCKPFISYGASFEGQLLACISFKNPTRQSKYQWELVRMASHPEYKIHGIWSKLFRMFLDKHKPQSIVSFSDNRLFSGGVYSKIGFSYDGDIPKNYYWVKNGKRYNKSGLRKKGIEKASEVTENQLRTAEGYHKVLDNGKKRWVWYCS